MLESVSEKRCETVELKQQILKCQNPYSIRGVRAGVVGGVPRGDGGWPGPPWRKCHFAPGTSFCHSMRHSTGGRFRAMYRLSRLPEQVYCHYCVKKQEKDKRVHAPETSFIWREQSSRRRRAVLPASEKNIEKSYKSTAPTSATLGIIIGARRKNP